MNLKSNEVFIPGAFPKYTYISRQSSEFDISYEVRLTQSLHTVGFLTSIIGPSKTGKTVLCEKVIGTEKMKSFSGSDFKETEDFWVTIARRVGLPLESEQTEQKTMQGQGLSGTREGRASAVTEKYHSNKDKVIQYFIENDWVLVLDDFHYASPNMQMEIAYQLKDAIRKYFKTVVISLPHRSDDAIRKNSDLSGRLNLINIEPWNTKELREIAVTGFDKLGLHIDSSIANDMAQESLSSPQLMQSICLNLCFLLDIDNIDKPKLDSSMLKKAYEMTSLNLLSYKEVARKLKSGPNPRGQKRKTYTINSGNQVDMYELLLKAISVDPPKVSLSIDEIKRRMDAMVSDADKPDRKKIKTTIDQVQSIMQTSEPMYQVFEYKDDKVYILEPLFLFYLRWGRLD
ncbi:ATP-binding protein [Brevibacillus gelatini]|uniref:ATP-binding protein n=1 Tax=Brevibacillus gelatini TaxID=1655277 RepID=A0A3M8APY0_9BACL|nr:ATP-binding protein [Brevibacillus gelatini]RNB53113.1 ATP-binding protein [Brevibacillus gelatini]